MPSGRIANLCGTRLQVVEKLGNDHLVVGDASKQRSKPQGVGQNSSRRCCQYGKTAEMNIQGTVQTCDRPTPDVQIDASSP